MALKSEFYKSYININVGASVFSRQFCAIFGFLHL